MVVALVGLAFFVGGLLGSIAMALACAAHDREEFSSSRSRDDGLGVPLSTGDTSKWN
jgi:hypothetical protein